MTRLVVRKIETACLPTSALLALLLTISSWMLTLLLWAGRILTNGQWPGGLKLSVCNAVSLGATVYMVTYGRRMIRKHRTVLRSQIGITVVQALWVFLLMLAVASFGTWLVWGPP